VALEVRSSKLELVMSTQWVRPTLRIVIAQV
jgi:hypothetical protein